MLLVSFLDARLAHRHRGRAVGAAGAGDRVRRHVRGRARPAPHHARRADHRARAAGRRRHHRDRDDGGEDGAGFRSRPRGDLRLDLDRVPDADRHAGDGRRLPAGRLRQFEHRRICRRHLLGRRPGADRVLVRGGAVHALSRREAAAGFRQARAAARTDDPDSDLRHAHLSRAARRDRALPALAQDRRGGDGVHVRRRDRRASGWCSSSSSRPRRRTELFFEMRLPEGSCDRRHRCGGQEGRAPARRRSRHRDLHELRRPGRAALLARAQSGAAERELRADRHRHQGPRRRASASRRGSNRRSPTARCRRRARGSTASSSVRRSAIRCSSA